MSKKAVTFSFVLRKEGGESNRLLVFSEKGWVEVPPEEKLAYVARFVANEIYHLRNTNYSQINSGSIKGYDTRCLLNLSIFIVEYIRKYKKLPSIEYQRYKIVNHRNLLDSYIEHKNTGFFKKRGNGYTFDKKKFYEIFGEEFNSRNMLYYCKHYIYSKSKIIYE